MHFNFASIIISFSKYKCSNANTHQKKYHTDTTDTHTDTHTYIGRERERVKTLAHQQIEWMLKFTMLTTNHFIFSAQQLYTIYIRYNNMLTHTHTHNTNLTENRNFGDKFCVRLYKHAPNISMYCREISIPLHMICVS